MCGDKHSIIAVLLWPELRDNITMIVEISFYFCWSHQSLEYSLQLPCILCACNIRHILLIGWSVAWEQDVNYQFYYCALWASKVTCPSALLRQVVQGFQSWEVCFQVEFLQPSRRPWAGKQDVQLIRTTWWIQQKTKAWHCYELWRSVANKLLSQIGIANQTLR